MKQEITTLVLVGGGTGGHVTPLVALAQEVKSKHKYCQLTYIGARNDLIGHNLTDDKSLFNRRIFIFAGKWHRFSNATKLEILHFWRADFWKNLANLILIFMGFWQTLYYLIRHRPQLIFSKGGYVALNPCLVAKLLRIPLITHDSDAVLGVTHALFRNYAAIQLTGFKSVENTEEARQTNLRSVGVPVNPAFGQVINPQDKKRVLSKYNLSYKHKIILVTGGGAGARSLNRGVLDIIDDLDLPAEVQFIISTGSRYHQEAVEQAKQLRYASQVHVFDFIEDMLNLLRISFGVITRAGATILTEVSLAGRPAIIIPNPLLPRRHQVHNANIFKQAAWIVSDSGHQVDQQALKRAINELLTDSHKRIKYQSEIVKITNTETIIETLKAIEEVVYDEK